MGKTTTSVAVAWDLSQLYPGRVLLIDMDDQGNATETAGASRERAGVTEYLLSKIVRPETFRENYTVALNGGQLDVLPASHWFGEGQEKLRRLTGQQFVLRDKLKPLAALYDFVVIDCPPALNEMNYNAFVAADWFVVVAEPEPLAKKGLDKIMLIAQELRKGDNPGLQCAGILFTRFNANERGRVRQAVVAVAGHDYGPELILPSIRRDASVLEAQLHELPLQLYAPTSRAMQDYRLLTEALVARITGHTLKLPTSKVPKTTSN